MKEISKEILSIVEDVQKERLDTFLNIEEYYDEYCSKEYILDKIFCIKSS